MPPEVGSDNIDDVLAAIAEAEARCKHAEEAEDDDLFDAEYRVLIELEKRLADLEADEWFAGQREMRRDYWRAVL